MTHQISLSLPDPLFRAARDLADAREISIQQLLKNALGCEIAKVHRTARSPVRADERMVAMLRARLSGDFAYARDWFDLIERLRDRGLTLREAGGGLALFGAHNGARICKASDVGFSLNRLARQFGAPFPGEKLGSRDLFVSTTSSQETDVVDEIDF